MPVEQAFDGQRPFATQFARDVRRATAQTCLWTFPTHTSFVAQSTTRGSLCCNHSIPCHSHNLSKINVTRVTGKNTNFRNCRCRQCYDPVTKKLRHIISLKKQWALYDVGHANEQTIMRISLLGRDPGLLAASAEAKAYWEHRQACPIQK